MFNFDKQAMTKVLLLSFIIFARRQVVQQRNGSVTRVGTTAFCVMTRCETLCLRDGVLCENALARWHIVQSLKRWNFEALLSINYSRHLQQHWSWSQSILSGCISFTRPKSATLNKEQLYSAWMQKTKKNKNQHHIFV